MTTLTKRMAEDLTEYLREHGVRVRYMHSDIDTLERIEIIRDLRLGAFDVLVGINLLREGLDIPECGLVAILDADKEGSCVRRPVSFRPSVAARNVDDRVILYADKMTASLITLSTRLNVAEPNKIFNEINGITPQSIKRDIADVIGSVYESDYVTVDTGVTGEMQLVGHNIQAVIGDLMDRMKTAAAELEFEEAARLRDKSDALKLLSLGSRAPALRRRNGNREVKEKSPRALDIHHLISSLRY